VYTAELRTIGLCDATDSELSIRQLDMNFRDSKQFLLTTSGLNKKIARKKSDAIKYQRCLSDKTVNLVTNNNNNSSSSNNNNAISKVEVIEMTTDGGESTKRERLFSKNSRLLPGLNRLRNESVTRSKSFQEQNTQPRYERRLNNSRFFVKRLERDRYHLPEYNSDDTISQNYEMLTAASSQTDCGSDGVTEKFIYVPDAKLQMDGGHQRPAVQSGCGQRATTNFATFRRRAGDRNYSGHILGGILRRMRKFSLGWRKSKCKLYRGEFYYFIKKEKL
jgi:hypothetical protein